MKNDTIIFISVVYGYFTANGSVVGLGAVCVAVGEFFASALTVVERSVRESRQTARSCPVTVKVDYV